MPGILTVELAGTLLTLIGYHHCSNVGVDKAWSVLLSDPISVKENLNSFFGLRVK